MSDTYFGSTPTADLILADRGGVNPRRIIGTDLQCSWEIGNAGTLSARVPTRDVLAAGLTNDLRGKFVVFEHPTAGKWSGTITASPKSDGIMEVAAQSMAINLNKRLVSGTWNAPPGSALTQAFSQANSGAPTYITLGQVDGSGAAAEFSFAFEDMYDSVLPALTSDYGFEWHVSPLGILTFARRIGTDLQSSVRIEEGREILTGRWIDDMFPIVNRIIGIGVGMTPGSAEQGYNKKKKKKSGKKKNKWVVTAPATPDAYYNIAPMAVLDGASVARYGALEEFIAAGYVGDSNGLNNFLKTRLANRSGDFASSGEFTLADVGGIFGKFREGDTVGVTLGLSGVSGIMRVMVRALDLNTNTLSISGSGKLNG
jgi:hypothetical protein